MISPRNATAIYGVANDGEAVVPFARIRLQAGTRIMERDWPEIERAMQGVDGVMHVVHSPSDTYTYIAVWFASTPARHTDAGVLADCRAVCRAANITLLREPTPAPR